MRRPRRMRRADTGWAMRAVAVLAGVLLLDRVLPKLRNAVPMGERGERFGRGRASTPASTSARKAGHETQDLSGRTLAILVGGLGLTVAVVIGGMVGLTHMLNQSRTASLPRYTPQQTALVVPPPPNLQTKPEQHLSVFLAHEEQQLTHYGWTGPDHKGARIPIDRAMALVTGQPLDTAP